MRKTVAVAALVGASLLAGPAGAAPQEKFPTVCHLVTDRTGDAVWNPAGYIPVLPPGSTGSDEAMDITSADVASNNRMITAVLRVKKLSATSLNAPSGMSWRVSFTAGQFTFTLAAHASATGSPTFDATYSSLAGGPGYGGRALGVFDTAKNEVRITARLSLLLPQTDIKPGTVLRGVTGETAQEVFVPNAPGGPGGDTLYSVRRSVDFASGDNHYVAGAKSCVAVGK